LNRFKPKENKDKALTIKIETSLKESLESWAKQEGVKVSEFVRVLILEEAERRNKQ
jgi:uncharacterized protein (DUF1778 family)